MRKLLQIVLILVSLSITTLSLAGEKSLFWRLESPNGVISHLFGTIHTDDERVAHFAPTVVEALNNTELFMMEVTEVGDPSWFLMKQGSLEQQLSAHELEQVQTLADFHSLPTEMALRMKPWLLSVVFDLPRPQTPFAQDFLLQATAQSMGKPIEGIEDPQAHFGAMDSFTMDEQMLLLRAALKRSQADKQKDYELLIKAYLAGDADSILRLDTQMTTNTLPKELSERIRVTLLDNRNINMAERTIVKARVKPIFIAVGAAHLGGATGLLNAFRKAGFKLTALKK